MTRKIYVLALMSKFAILVPGQGIAATKGARKMFVQRAQDTGEPIVKPSTGEPIVKPGTGEPIVKPGARQPF